MDAQEVMHMTDYRKSQPFTPVFHIVHHAGVGRAVKKSAAFIIVDVVPDIGEVLPSGVVLQKDILILYAVALAAVPVLVPYGKAGVKGCDFAIISHEIGRAHV